ncbi:hypothetical protein PV755_09530 [Streptomyces caniscabiei]|uniref:Uncharacterized protein n=1 Tax=Streptomyces caniscabiei TaxID=2746961 RepID=A0A927KZ70_9ACTN|nr:hypothetical protein [Streptomyces caniscabiei]MBD9721971.1 hypothetical protein [Streptomyces caniscabiei]MDX3509163.1 hypothetical protein [Streptomyces caniscabiei]MDX3717084.1 hypothetical protein [Streptomyces caniscabiei]WEO22952.1 hypothetical protein IHE65_07195 [Streptomyces caniscabiei]
MTARPVVGLARGGRYDEQQLKAAIEDGLTGDHMPESALDRLSEYAETCRQLHNRVRPLLPKEEQDELLTLSIGLGMAALEQHAARKDPS